MIFSTLFFVLCFLSGPAFSTIPDAAAAKNYIGEIQKIIGGDISPALSSLLSEKENWDFLLQVEKKLSFDSNSSKIMEKFYRNLLDSAADCLDEITEDIDSQIYSSYLNALDKLASFSAYTKFFFPNCIKILQALRDMKDPEKIAKENAAFKKGFVDAPTPIKFLTDLFEAFKEAVKVFPKLKSDVGNDHLAKLKAAVDKPLATLKAPQPTEPQKEPQKDSQKDPQSNNTNTPPNEWSNLKKALVFISITLAIIAVISIIVFLVLRKSKSAASSA
jgi:hypothetical protein